MLRVCLKGKPCGRSCIARDKRCHKGVDGGKNRLIGSILLCEDEKLKIGPNRESNGRNCVRGKRCGRSCIASYKVCRKDPAPPLLPDVPSCGCSTPPRVPSVSGCGVSGSLVENENFDLVDEDQDLFGDDYDNEQVDLLSLE